MSFAVLGNNVSIKVNAAVSNSSSAASATLYTAPANGYAIVQVGIDNGGSGAVLLSVGGLGILNYNPTDNVWNGQNGTGGAFTALTQSIYLGPSQSISYSGNLGGTVTVTGVSFINSP
ncbi:MAG TPA: hypothetical protein V6C58_24590 [Allocoleopsis sp.]